MPKSRAIRPICHLSIATALALFVSILFRAAPASALPTGIDSSRFANLSLGCNNCHQTQPPTAIAPTVALSASSTSITTGQPITLTFVVTSNNPTVQIAAGFNVRSSQQGTFAVGGSGSLNTRTIANGNTQWLEATHSMPRNNDVSNQATFTTLWTPMPAVNGTVTFTAWGNSVNLSGTNVGDRAATTTLDINVVAACTPTPWYRDADGDGYGDSAVMMSSCTQPAGYVADHTDCNDVAGAGATIHPGAAEMCNGVDDNCNVTIDEGVTTTYYRDVDGDGYGAAAPTALGCTPPAGYVANNTDCNDGAVTIHPGAAEMCNGVDDNCAGGVDEGLTTTPFYVDADHDGYGNPNAPKSACNLDQAGAGYVANNTDCNDASDAVHPGAPESCNGADDNCNLTPDDGLTMNTYYRDADGDGFGALAMTKPACSLAVAGAGYVANSTDCDDTNGNIFPGAPEICGNAKDDNCNGVTDTDAPANSTFYKDTDGDGYGSAASGTATACAPPTGFVSSNTDCNDAVAAIHPGAPEICNDQDDDCNGTKDDGLGTLTCGDGPCHTTVAACVSGTPQTCVPVCPEAGIDAGPDAAAPDATPQDSAITPSDAARSDVALAPDVATSNDASSTDAAIPMAVDAGSPDVSEIVDAVSAVDSAPKPPDARADARVDAPTSRVADAGPSTGATEDDGAPTDSGCSCRIGVARRASSSIALGAGLALFVLARRRSRRT